MSEPIPRESAFQRLGRRVRYIIVLLSSGLLVMTLSYHASLWHLRHETPPSRAAQEGVSSDESLEALSQQMIALMREYLDRASNENSSPSQAFRDWSLDAFAPRVSDLRRRIQAASSEGEAWNAMLVASDRMVAMARQPGQASLRQLATDNVFDAAAAVENRLGATGSIGRDGS